MTQSLAPVNLSGKWGLPTGEPVGYLMRRFDGTNYVYYMIGDEAAMAAVIAGDAAKNSVWTASPAGMQAASPTTGQTVQAEGNVGVLMLSPAGLLAALTVGFPQGPVDGQSFVVVSTQIVTVLSLTGGTVQGSVLSALGANVAFEWRFSSALSKWVRVQ